MIEPPKNTRNFSALVNVVEALRGPKGCPWDLEQTHESLTQYAIEEAHELAEAIESGDDNEVKSELGDLLLQVVLHSEIAKQRNGFTLEDVIQSITDKMIRRHPHVFTDLEVTSTEEISANWQKIKEQEKKKSGKEFAGFDIPKSLPALQRAEKIGWKTKKKRFDWPSAKQVLEKVDEELGELKEAMETQALEQQTHEVGDLLFSVAQLARHLGIDPEQALRKTNNRFETRFAKMLEICKREQLDFDKMPENDLEELWQKAKKELKTVPSE